MVQLLYISESVLVLKPNFSKWNKICHFTTQTLIFICSFRYKSKALTIFQPKYLKIHKRAHFFVYMQVKKQYGILICFCQVIISNWILPQSKKKWIVYYIRSINCDNFLTSLWQAWFCDFMKTTNIIQFRLELSLFCGILYSGFTLHWLTDDAIGTFYALLFGRTLGQFEI